MLFESRRFAASGYRAAYDVAPDGRLLMISTGEAGQSFRFRLVLNWFTELLERVPVED